MGKYVNGIYWSHTVFIVIRKRTSVTKEVNIIKIFLININSDISSSNKGEIKLNI
jgi:hypothetical protein